MSTVRDDWSVLAERARERDAEARRSHCSCCRIHAVMEKLLWIAD